MFFYVLQNLYRALNNIIISSVKIHLEFLLPTLTLSIDSK